MLVAIIINYSIVAMLGLYLFVKLFAKTPSKMLTGIIHGALGLFGLGMFVFYISFQRGETPVAAFLLLLLAFFFGAGLFVTKLSGRKFPKLIAIIHILIAAAGIIMLVQFYVS